MPRIRLVVLCLACESGACCESDGAAGSGQRRMQLGFGADQPMYTARYGTVCGVTDCMLPAASL